MFERFDGFESLRRFGVDTTTLGTDATLCLPENLETATRAEELYDAMHTADLVKHLRAAGVSCGDSRTLGLSSGILERRGADLWLGLIWAFDNVAGQLALGVLSNFISDWLARCTGRRQAPVAPASVVDLKLRLIRGESRSVLDYRGDGQTLLKILKSLQSPPDHE